MMTSLLVFRKLGVTPKGSVSELMLHQNTNRKPALAILNHYITFHIGQHLVEKMLLTSIPDLRKLGITSKREPFRANITQKH